VSTAEVIPLRDGPGTATPDHLGALPASFVVDAERVDERLVVQDMFRLGRAVVVFFGLAGK
jgi:hypothetical protein